ncbi:MAG: tetratricopeptide repeat protein [Hellea sp.]|nr:tetratricopeptide repeat protein [Hellea sp.]
MKTLFKSNLLASTGAKSVLLLAGFAVMAGCSEKSDTNMPANPDTNIAESASAETPAMGMEGASDRLPATTSNRAALANYNAGWADFENSRFVTAYEHFESAASKDPSFTMAHVMAAWVAPSTDGFVSYTNAASAIKAGASEGEQQLVTMLERFLANDAEGARDAAKKVTELHPKSPRAWNFLGATHAGINETDAARKAYHMATKLDANFVPGFINLGNNYLTQEPKDFDKAESLFRKAVALTPSEPNPHDLLGDVHRAQNKLEAAYDNYTMAAELAPDLGSGLQQRGHVNSFLGNFDEARADYNTAADLEDARGSTAGPNFRVFRAYVHLHEGMPNNAIAELQGIADSLSGSSMDGADDIQIGALYNIALIAIEEGKADIAAKAINDAGTIQMQQAERVKSDDIRNAGKATQLYHQGLLAARMGDSAKAEAKAGEFENLVAGNSNPRKFERMHEILGMNAYQQGDFALAAEHFAKGNHVNNMYTKYYLARAHEQAGNGEKAAKLYDEMAVYNFNGPGYAMFRKDIVERAGGTH